MRLFRLLGYRERTYRRRAVEALRLRPGDTAVDIGCGTGLNFPLIERAIGPEGRLVGVDLTRHEPRIGQAVSNTASPNAQGICACWRCTLHVHSTS